LREFALIAVSGALGAVARYGASGLAYRWFGERLAWGTLLVNVAGCYLLGLLMELSVGSEVVSRDARLALGVGFLGAFTTFSTFGYETLRYVEEGAWGAAVLNVASNLLLGLLAAWLGVVTARVWMGGPA